MARGVLTTALLLSAGCVTDTCAELVQKCCGEGDRCAASSGCQSAKRMLEQSVQSACSAALDDGVGYPDCRDMH